MGFRRHFVVAVAAALGLSAASASVFNAAASNYKNSPKDLAPRGRKDDIYAMPNADAQYYKKHQHGMR